MLSRLLLSLFALAAFLTPNPLDGKEPQFADLAYDQADEKAQRLDVYLADTEETLPAMVYLHGGGWRAGSKKPIPAFLRHGLDQGWFHVVAVEYRFTDVAPHPAQVHDSVRAIQFVRHHAATWKIDPERIGVTGGSAGAHLSLWVALHDDLKDPKAEDPVARHSSRVSCAVGFAGPTDWSLLKTIEHRHPAYRQLLGYEPGTPASEMSAKKKESVSPISFASADDPPVLLVHGDADQIVPLDHATALKEQLEEAKAPVELMVVKGAGHQVAGAGGDAVRTRALEFIRKHLEIKTP